MARKLPGEFMTGSIMSTQLGKAPKGPGVQDMGIKFSMSAAAACSGSASPYFEPGLALPYEGGVAKQAPQGLVTRGFKRACEHS
eukprot:257441-Karenia_brevis.AAC.2